jgi:hypothetical protein
MPDGKSVRPACPETNRVESDRGTLCLQPSQTPTSVGSDMLFSQPTAAGCPAPLTTATLGVGVEALRPANTVPSPSHDVKKALPTVSPAGFSIVKFVTWLDENAFHESQGVCAMHIRIGLEAGGLDTTARPDQAKDYGPFLLKVGFTQVSPIPPIDYAPNVGDIMVIQPPSTSKKHAGHIQTWGGKYWISDFKQKGVSAPWPGKSYADDKPPYAVYRCR